VLNKKKFFLAGSAGMLGTSIYKVFNESVSCFVQDINDEDDHVSYLDFRDYDMYLNNVKAINPDYLCHIGAHTDLEYCHNNPQDAFDTNTKSVEHAVEISNQLNIPLVYISTAGIFNGNYDYYSDLDIPNPLGIYARSKFYGEQIIEKYSKNFLICRAGWMMGGGLKKDKKFIGKLLRQVIDGKKVWDIVNDKFGTPTYTNDFAKNLLLLINSNRSGLYNLVCEGNTNRLEVALFLKQILDKKFNIQININEVESNFFKKEYFSPRPNNECLINLRLNYLKLNEMRHWKIALEDYMQEWKF
jgi:dTDP-4-dehydrorhamnose reductase